MAKYNWIKDKFHTNQVSCLVEGHRIDRTTCANGTQHYYICDKNGKMIFNERPHYSMSAALKALKYQIAKENKEWTDGAARREELRLRALEEVNLPTEEEMKMALFTPNEPTAQIINFNEAKTRLLARKAA
jgi:hypothetical protein